MVIRVQRGAAYFTSAMFVTSETKWERCHTGRAIQTMNSKALLLYRVQWLKEEVFYSGMTSFSTSVCLFYWGLLVNVISFWIRFCVRTEKNKHSEQFKRIHKWLVKFYEQKTTLESIRDLTWENYLLLAMIFFMIWYVISHLNYINTIQFRCLARLSR